MRFPEFDISGRKAVLIGAARGIGRGVADVLAEAGAELAIASMNPASAEQAASAIRAAGGKARSFADLARALYAAAGRNANIEYVDTPEAIRDKYQYFTEARMERLRAAGYELPMTSLEDGIRMYVRDHLATADPYV